MTTIDGPSGSAAQTAVEPLVDVVIAVHSPTRPIERAVGSVLEHTNASVRVTVVVHNTDRAPVEERLSAWLGDSRLRLVHFRDGIPSPAGPMNHGFDLATAEYVSLLGSDDSFEPGAIDAWIAAAADGVDVVIAPLLIAGRTVVPTPPVRLGRRAGLRGAADRLAYRTAPLGLIRRARLGDLRFPEGVSTGEDQPFTAALWFAGGKISFPVEAPGYLVHEDQGDRVTRTSRPVSEEFAVLDRLLVAGAPWLATADSRLALLSKTIRVHVLDAYRNRRESWDDRASAELDEVVNKVLEVEPRALRVLSRNEAGLLAALRDPRSDAMTREKLDRARASLRQASSVLTRDPRYLFHPQAPFRLRLAGSIIARSGRRRVPPQNSPTANQTGPSTDMHGDDA